MTVIIAEIFCGIPILIGDTAVTYPQYNGSGIDAPLRDGSSFIHSAQQKIIQINSHFALGGAGDADTIQEFVNRIIQKSEKLCTLEHLENILSEINFDAAKNSEIIGVFYPGGSGESTAFYIDIRPSKSRKSSCLSLGNRFCIGSGARLVEKRLANFEHIRDDNSLPSDTIEARILGIINNLMLEDRETGEAQRSRFGLSYTAIWHDGYKFKRIPNYISLFGTFILSHRAVKHMNLEWKEKSGSILTVSCAEDELKIQEVREGERKGQRWIIPSLINVELLQKHEITWTERDSISVKNPKYFLLCTYIDVQKPDLSGFSSVPLVGQWVLNDMDDFSIEDCGKRNFPWEFLNMEMLKKLVSKAIDDAKRHWGKDN